MEEKIVNILKEKYPIDALISFNEFNIADKLKNHAFELMKWSDFLLKEKFKLQKLTDELEEVTCVLYNKYRFEFDKNLSKVEIEKYYIPQDPEYKKLMKKIRIQEIIVAYFEICVRSIDKQGWNMKNFIEQNRVM